MAARTIVLALLLALAPFFVSCVDDIAFYSTNGHYYQLVKLDSPISFNNASALANSRFHNSKQGYVCTIGDAGEQSWLTTTYFNQVISGVTGVDYVTVWGGAQRRSDNFWIWTAVGRVSNPFFDGTKQVCSSGQYCNWYTTGAANFPTSSSCLQVFLNNTNGPTPGTWRPVSCTALSYFVVIEYDASTTCEAGYTYNAAKGWCEDVNECANNAKICGTGYQCVNTIGSYNCQDIDECQNTSICKPGFQCVNSNGSYSCNDIDECAETPSVCSTGYSCQNTVGSYTCSDINECSLNSTLCSKGYSCVNTPGSYRCDDINECVTSSPCPFGTRCQNTIGSYTCDLLWYFIRSDWNNLVLDYMTDDSGMNYVITQTQNPANISRQLWSLTQDGYITNRDNKYVMDAQGGLVYPGVFVILWPQKRIEEAQNQLWVYLQDSHMWTGATNNNVVMDIYHAQYSPGAQVCLFSPKQVGSTPEGPANQQWSLIEYASSPSAQAQAAQQQA